MGGLFLLSSYLVGVENIPQLIFFLFISFVFVLLTFYDFLFKEVPDAVSLPSFAVILVYMIYSHIFSWSSLLIGILIPVLFFGILHFGSRGRWLGGGDIRIGAIMGALLGYPMILTGLFFGYLLGSIISLVGMATGKLNRRSQIPFVPFLLSGAYIALFWGQHAVDWYMGLL